MTTPETIAAQVRAAIYNTSASTPRAQQSADRILGMSDIGQCRSMLARMIDGHPRHPREEDIKWAAFIGTAIGDLIEAQYPRAQVPVVCTLPNGLKVRGTADAVTDDGPLDFKSADGLDYVRRNGPDFGHLAQISGYLVGLRQQGEWDDTATEPVGALVYLDRSGKDDQPYVHIVTLTEAHDILDQVVDRLEDVTYAIAHGIDENAPRDKPRTWCEVACPFVTECRGSAPDSVEGLITDNDTLTAIATYNEGKEMEKAGAKLAAQAKEHLRGVEGSTGAHTIYWTSIPESVVPETKRRASQRLNVRPIR